jgi:hypothetical protein
MTESSDAPAQSVRSHLSSPNVSSPTELSLDFDEEESFLGGEEEVALTGSRASGEDVNEDDEVQELGQRPRYYEEEDWFDEADQEAFNSTHHPDRDEELDSDFDPIEDADDFDVVVENDLDEYEE